MTERIADAQARRQALTPDRSFIVQAPAGSGKTELLTQRVLRLLATVERPEEILAMTFTRKAAAEMKQRILEALEAARGAPPEAAYKRDTWQLASAALARNDALGWGLLDSPSRLRVMTIDSLSASLTRQMLLLSQFGGNPGVAEDARPLYLEAARNTLEALEAPDIGPQVGLLLSHLENDPTRAAQLIARLLGSREQWLGPLLRGDSREALEQALADAVREHLEALQRALPHALLSELGELAEFAAAQRQRFHKKPQVLAAWLVPGDLPRARIEDLPRWRGLAELCLSGAGTVRKRVNVADGFPADSAADDEEEKARFVSRKAAMMDCLAELAEQPAAVALLVGVRDLPMPRYAEGQWQMLAALSDVLQRAAAELQLVFARHGEVDFNEIHLRALTALGEPQQPTDLALTLDYRLRHLLVDEFQDTSSGQYELLIRLTSGWQPGDGRTLFAVGDPMQSIYGFRQAEVGLFLQAWENGIGDLPLEPLQLQVNFRSQAGIVDWVNQAFDRVLPPLNDPTTGAVRYSPSTPHQPALPDAAVSIHPAAERDDDAEAAKVVALVRQTLDERPDGSIAILVRSRGHLHTIALALKTAGLAFRAVDVEPLAHLPVVQDIHNLTRALLHPADRLAWFSLLRSPLIGMTLDDLLTIGSGVLPWQRLADPAVTACLDEHARQRLGQVLPVLAASLAEHRRRPLRDRVAGCWRALGGEAAMPDAADTEAVTAYLDLLQQHDQAADLADFAAFEEALGGLYAPADTRAGDQLQLMTMHKSKGLEFDTVILPGLGKGTRSDDKPLLSWLERPDRSGRSQLLIAPINPSRQRQDPVFDYVRGLNRRKRELENARLLYVAATRARQRLHLLGHVTFSAKGEPRAAGDSLLATLWPAVSNHFRQLEAPAATPPETQPSPAMPIIERLPADWQPAPSPPSPALPAQPTGSDVGSAIPFDWVGETARHVGSLVHRYLEHIGREGLEAWDEARIRSLQGPLQQGLQGLGVREDALEDASDRVTLALSRTLQDPRGRWLLADHAQARCEWALSGHLQGRVWHQVIDRSFVDQEGTRWIIDYKSGHHAGADVDAFLDQEQARYREQLERYASLVSRLGPEPIMLGLYFPLLQGWRSWRWRG